MENIIDEIFGKISAELLRAESKFPWWPFDPLHAHAIVAEEFGELAKACVDFRFEHVERTTATSRMEKEAIQAAAMCVRFLIGIGHYKTRGDDPAPIIYIKTEGEK